MSEQSDMKNAIDLVVSERKRQNELWGCQSETHPYEWLGILGEEYGELCEAVNETYFENPTHPERGGRDKILKEAVQVAAVALQIIENILVIRGGDRKWQQNPSTRQR